MEGVRGHTPQKHPGTGTQETRSSTTAAATDDISFLGTALPSVLLVVSVVGTGVPAHSPTSLADSSSLTGLCPRTDHFLRRVLLPSLGDEARSHKLFGCRRDGPSEARSAQ